MVDGMVMLGRSLTPAEQVEWSSGRAISLLPRLSTFATGPRIMYGEPLRCFVSIGRLRIPSVPERESIEE
jgi:hypothetical protein